MHLLVHFVTVYVYQYSLALDYGFASVAGLS